MTRAPTPRTLPIGERHPYVTQRAHGSKPAGTACVVFRTEDALVLVFPDGDRVDLPPSIHAHGLEDPQAPPFDAARWLAS
jgi:hypothetical protein